MKIVQTIIQKVACVAILAAGGALLLFPISGIYDQIVAQLPAPNPTLRVAIGCVVAALAIFALLPLDIRRRKSQQLTFTGANGDVTIQLDPIATTLNKTVNKLPVVKKATIRVRPAKSGGKADVVADVSIRKPADTGARETADQLRVYIDEIARHVLGTDEIANVTINIIGIEMEGLPSAEAMNHLPSRGAISTPVAAPIEERAPAVHEIPESLEEESSPPSSDLMSYEESARVAQAEASALSGDDQKDVSESPAARNQDVETEDTAREADSFLEPEPGGPAGANVDEAVDDTSFTSPTDGASPPGTDEEESEDLPSRPKDGP